MAARGLKLQISAPKEEQEPDAIAASGGGDLDDAALEEFEFLGDVHPENLVRLADLGEGASGSVTLCKDNRTGTIMAVKRIAMFDKTKIKEIRKELSTMLGNPCDDIITLHGAFLEQETHTMAICLEYMDVGSLLDVLNAAGPIPETILQHIVTSILRGLHFLHHNKHYIHRDLKPSNILINSSGKVKITDFGVSGEVADTLATAKTFIGTVNYMAPERLSGNSYTSSVDIWSLGLLILQCAVGEFPYSRFSSSSDIDGGLGFWQLLQYIQNNPSPTLPRNGQFSSEMGEFIDQCLIKERNRPTSEQLLQHEWIVNASRIPAQQFTPHYRRWLDRVIMKVNEQRRKQATQAQTQVSTEDLLASAFN